MAIDVTRSKTDQLRKGSETVIASGSSVDTCPVNILRRFLTKAELNPVNLGHYILRPLLKCRSGHKFVSVNKPISYSGIRGYCKRSYCPGHLSVGHSFLKGWWCFSRGECRRAATFSAPRQVVNRFCQKRSHRGQVGF